MKTINIIVSPKGETTLQTKGFAGAECQEASRQLESALGIRQGEQLTPEFHQTTGIQQNARQCNGN